MLHKQYFNNFYKLNLHKIDGSFLKNHQSPYLSYVNSSMDCNNKYHKYDKTFLKIIIISSSIILLQLR